MGRRSAQARSESLCQGREGSGGAAVIVDTAAIRTIIAVDADSPPSYVAEVLAALDELDRLRERVEPHESCLAIDEKLEETRRELDRYKEAVADQFRYDMRAILTDTPENRTARELSETKRELAERDSRLAHVLEQSRIALSQMMAQVSEDRDKMKHELRDRKRELEESKAHIQEMCRQVQTLTESYNRVEDLRAAESEAHDRTKRELEIACSDYANKLTSERERRESAEAVLQKYAREDMLPLIDVDAEMHFARYGGGNG